MNTPFFLIGNLLGSLCPVHIPQDKIFNNPNFKDLPDTVFFRIFGFVFAHNIYALLGLLILYNTLRINKVNEWLSSILVLLTYFASPLHYYAQSGMSHANSFFLMACVMYCFSKFLITRKPYFWLLMGLCIGMATAVRYTNGLALPVSFLFALIVSDTKRCRSLLYLTGGFCGYILDITFVLVDTCSSGQTGIHSVIFLYTNTFVHDFTFATQRFFYFPSTICSEYTGLYFISAQNLSFAGIGSTQLRLYFLCACLSLSALCTATGENITEAIRIHSDTYSNCLPMFTFCMVPLFMLKRPWRTVIIVFTVTVTAFSYVMFLVCLSRILMFPEGYIWPQYIGEYGYLFTQDHTISEFLNGLKDHILTLKALNI